jgi:3-hydroxyacyl-[acyl-carrier-protein] dehydratase
MSIKPECPGWLRAALDKQVFDRDQQTVAAELCCPVDFPAFAGHFPEQPVLPAVMQLLVVRMLGADLLQIPLEPVRTGKLKFKGMIRPDERIQVRVTLALIADRWQADFRLKNRESIVSTGTIFFTTRQG